MLYPLTFHPIFKSRIWGGRRLEALYRKPLPPSGSIGESWEMSDLPGEESVIANGPLAGKSLRWVMQHHRESLIGGVLAAAGGRFPLLCKILDASETLSLQVHPPAEVAGALGGEPKTEMWYIAEAEPGAELFVGLKRGVTREEFSARIGSGDVAGCLHRIPVRRGDAMFLPSGRVHAIGAGLVIFEIQQSSDTTYRVFDWNRAGLDGAPRDLHVPQSLASIDFGDVEPPLAEAPFADAGALRSRPLVRDPLFHADAFEARIAGCMTLEGAQLRILAVTEGGLEIRGGGEVLPVRAGQFCLVPAEVAGVTIDFAADCGFLDVTAGTRYS